MHTLTPLRRRLLVGGAASLALPYLARAQATSLIAINDGVTYRPGAGSDTDDRYAVLVKDLNKALGSKLVIQKVPKYVDLAIGLTAGEYDMAFVHPGHHAIRALQSKQYKLAAVSKSHINYKANFLVRGDSKVTKPEDLSGKTVYLPDADSITAWMARACFVEMYDKSMPLPKFVSLRYQDAIRFAVENHMGWAGATAAMGEVRAWAAAKHRVLFTSKNIPIKQFLVHQRMASQVDATREFLLSQTDTVRISVPDGFAPYEEAALIKAWDWLGKGVIPPGA